MDLKLDDLNLSKKETNDDEKIEVVELIEDV